MKKHKLLRNIIIILSAITLFCIANIIWSANVLTYNEYVLETDKINNDIKFVVVSDSEGKEFGENNGRLIDKILEANPEFVILAGDMVDEETQDTKSVLSLCKGLVKHCPVYYTLGNHEDNTYKTVDGKRISSFKSKIESTGAHLLINEMAYYISDNGDTVTIAGLRTYPFFEFDAPLYKNKENELFQDYLRQENAEHFSLLLCHQPEVSFWGLKDYDIDLMISGHTHGGIVRIPFIGGIVAPEQGIFPDYDKGYYHLGKMNMIISAGLGNSNAVPRFNNPPDVTVVTLKAKG